MRRRRLTHVIQTLVACSCVTLISLSTMSGAGAAGPTSQPSRTVADTPWSVSTSYGAPLENLIGISCPSSSVCIATGENTNLVPTVVETTNGGATWTEEAVPSEVSYLYEIDCPSTAVCYAAAEIDSGGKITGAVLTTTDGGSSWSIGGIPSSLQNLQFIDCLSTSMCYA